MSLLTSYDGIGTSDRWNYVLHNALGKRPSNTFDVELSGSGRSLFVKPLNMFWIVCVKLLVCA